MTPHEQLHGDAADGGPNWDAELVALATGSVEEGLAGPALTIAKYMSEHGLAGGVEVGTSAAAADSLSRPDADSVYQIGPMIAQGGMGAILGVRDLNIRRNVAMKVMLEAQSAGQDSVLRFIEEAQVTSQLEHPNIVPVHEVGINGNGRVYYTMKKVEGETLDDILTGIRDGNRRTIDRYPLNHLLTIFMKTCDALAFAHAKGVVHRDLKPENIMVGEYGEVLVMDWGLAKVLRGKTLVQDAETDDIGRSRETGIDSIRVDDGANAGLTMAGQVMGTPSFMAPEQALGKIDAIDARTDIYGLGAILYNILTLRPPVMGNSIAQVLLRVTKGEITAPTELANTMTPDEPTTEPTSSPRVTTAAGLQQRAMEVARQRRVVDGGGRPQFPHCPGGTIPPALSAVAMRALALEQNERYADVQQLQRDIEAYQNGFATTAEAAGLGRSLLLLLRRHRLQVTLVLAGMITLGLLATGFVWRIDRERDGALANEQRILSLMTDFEEQQALQQELSTMSGPPYLQQAESLLARGRWVQALGLVQESLTLDARSVSTWWLKGQLALGLLDLDAAGEAFGTVAKLDPDRLGKQVEPYQQFILRTRAERGDTAITPLEGWKQGLYHPLTMLPQHGPVHFTYAELYRFLTVEYPDQWIPLLRDEREARAWFADWPAETRGCASWRDGVLKLTSGVYPPPLPIEAADVAVRAKVRLLDGRHFAFKLRWSDADGLYYAWIGESDRCGISFSAGQQEGLSGDDLTRPENEYVELLFAATGQRLELTVDGLEATDAEDDRLGSGRIGLQSFDASVLIRDLEVKVTRGPDSGEDGTAHAASRSIPPEQEPTERDP